MDNNMEWRDVESAGMPPCNGEKVFVGINTNGFAACFNEVAPHGACSMRGPELSTCQMSGLKWWRELDHPGSGWKVVPDWKGYARLGTGNYVINHSADFDPELGAELMITLATDADKAGNRQIGETRDNPDNAALVQADDMVIRIGFLSERALFALEDQLRLLRELHFGAAKADTGASDER